MNEIRALAERLYNEYGTCDPLRLCEYIGITVIVADLPMVTDGLYYCVGEQPVILINQELEARRMAITAAHELGHALLHPQVNYLFMANHTYMETGRFEREADYFCACLLMHRADECEIQTLCPEKLCAITGLSDYHIELWKSKIVDKGSDGK